MKLITTRYTDGEGWATPLPSCQDGDGTLVLAFCAPRFDANPAPLQQIAAAFPRSWVAGCSSAGEISGTSVQDRSVSLAVARFEHTRLRQAFAAVSSSADSFAAGVELAAQLPGQLDDEPLRAVFLLSDGISVNGSSLVEGLSSHLPAGVVLTGGMSGDGDRFYRTWVLRGEQAAPGHICAIGFYGHRLRIGHGCEGGWSDFGPERRITRAEGNVLYELDGKPVLELYKNYLGERAQGLPGTALLFPLAVRRDSESGDAIVRTVLSVDEARQSLTFAGDLPAGGVARLMRANTDKLIDSAGNAARAASVGASDVNDALVISVSCVGRRLVLGERCEEEVEAVAENSPCRSAHVGFYSYGEISPAWPGGASDLHNQTMTVTVFSEG